MPYGLILDDHPLVAKGIAEYLQALPPHLPMHAASSAVAARQQITRHGAPQIVLLDYWLAEGHALPMMGWLRITCPHCPVLVMSGDDSPTLRAQSRDAGAAGFVHKQEPPETFGRAMNALLAGAHWGLADPLPKGATVNTGWTASELGLTPRQAEVLTLMLKGLPNKRIASTLGLSESTIKEHVTGVLERLGVRTRVEAMTLLYHRTPGDAAR